MGNTRRIFGLVLYAVSLTSVGCNYDDAAYDKPRSSALILRATPATADADGTANVLVSVTDTSPTNRTTSVVLRLSSGSWDDGGQAERTVTLDAAGQASARVRSPIVAGTTFIMATAGGSLRSDSIIFRRAEPDTIDVAPAALVTSARTTTAFVVSLSIRRNVGAVSAGWRPSLRAMDSTETRDIALVQLSGPSDADGKVTATLAMRDTLYAGPMSILARLRTDTGRNVAGKAVVLVRP
jgi:hypothetical protein